MEILITAVVAFVVGFVLGGLVTSIRQGRAFYKILLVLGVTTEQLLKLKQKIDPEPSTDTAKPRIEIRLEKMGDEIYAYRKDTMQFIAQGRDREALIQHLNHTFARGARLIIREQDGAHLVKTL